MYRIKKRGTSLAVLLIISLVLGAFSFANTTALAKATCINNNSSTWEWETSTPEQQGMDSAKLLDMFKAIEDNKTPIHSLLIVKNGKLVTEAYFDPYDKNMRHALYSATKSVTSTLVGIAIKEGYIKGVDQKVLDFFPDITLENDQYQGKDMTIENLLTMSTGHRDDSSQYVFTSMDFPKSFFGIPFSSKPGTKFYYDSGASHLLSVILTKATGMSTDQYAKKHLFDPMGITDYTWETDLSGINIGGWGLKMTPRDMAKFGQLAINWGKWCNKQLVPKEWLEVATSKHIDAYWGEVRADDYGYQWWRNFFGGYRADGYGGQFVYVLPEQDLVVVFTSGINYSEKMQPGNYVNDYIIPSAKSSKPIKPNSKPLMKLKNFIKGLESPKSGKSSSLPKIAQEISGKVYKMDLTDISLSFDFKKKNSSVLNIKQNGSSHVLTIGLDGVYRISKASQVGTMTMYPLYSQVALKGNWVNENTFEMDWHYVGEPFCEVYRFIFDGSKITVDITKYLEDTTGLSPKQLVLTGMCE
ncbi:MAG TPA: serine hydrolase [Pseudobacteroides sp.]|uniref:serine hydrolase domain-containing protein n=1 Tax=Pseudobacteroides sp. TaxID=1968840 RepID=UPI002F94F296